MASVLEVCVCTVEDVPSGEGIRVDLADLPEPVAVFNDAGRFYALSDMCSHAEASLADGWIEDCQVECPLHSARFDLLTGKACSLPAILPVRAYPVTMTDGKVYVSVPTVGGT
ncbi:bifunctional 3-phenylpropionate/cinnamic acid dioxygenase ferredoxin subunit [Pseudonocardia sp. K10HN5]|uniref:Bifunctional 3-phenylpropionate/cinnamic acid dioxygenase ferredoxin subunit n=2 Tax=Pseudonocardia acidicola TaxID=2724939 RepID=A0ABX1S8E2_9PSEU|nr:bifunctional 3-phenylpropionate/cinnamic acid dioxygenase ferredoxin subunit [Pseudonocardia acidicola]NMH97350.1 bifunctional 3-phenylpropionate/cinnamic acid dioxygenase ferredoxin subunit [Pseudonocardia acidicola]